MQDKFILYGYSCPTDGSYFMDGREYSVGEDFRTVERYIEYKDCGFNILLHEGNDPYVGDAFGTSNLKSVMDKAEKAGLKVICFDQRIHDLSTHENLVGAGRPFRNDEELEKYILHCMKDYTLHPTFFGVQLVDEPGYRLFPTIGRIYKIIKKHYPDCFVKVNLFPAVKWVKDQFSPDEDKTVPERYEQYLRAFIRETNADYLMFDSYPMCIENKPDSYWIRPDHFDSLQAAVKVCKEKNLELYVVTQTCSHSFNGEMCTRKCSDKDMYWLTNLLVGLGVSRIMYFTYWRKQVNRAEGEWFYDDGSSIMYQNGEKTALYDCLKKIHSELQNFAPVILSYKFDALKFFRGKSNSADYANTYHEYNFDRIDNVKCSDDGLFIVTLLKKSGSYMLMIENINDPDVFVGKTETISFTSKGKVKAVYEKGEKIRCSFNKEIRAELASGQAIFIEIEE